METSGDIKRHVSTHDRLARIETGMSERFGELETMIRLPFGELERRMSSA